MERESEAIDRITFGMSRYLQPRWRSYPASARFCRSRDDEVDRYVHALENLVQEDEEIPLPSDRGPVVFRDGVFQIDMNRMEEKGDIDIELKKLIDSIMGA